MEISVIIPTYKPQSYLYECLDSMFRQTINNKDFEVIIVVNGEIEPYFSDIKKYIQNKHVDINVKVIASVLSNVSHARNMGIEASLGKNICFIDDDDWVSDNYLQNLYEALDSKIGMSIANVLNYNESKGSYENDYLTKAYNKAQKKDESLVDYRSFFSTACCKMISRQAIGDFRFNPNFKKGEDSLFMASISKNINSIKLANNNTLYYRRLRANSASRKKTKLCGRVKDACLLIKEYTKIYLSDFYRYDMLFFMTRVAATLLKIVTK